MKKHNEGYAMVLVLVVITVLSLVAMAMMAASLRNLQNQQDSIERMTLKYAVQGKVEQGVSAFEKLLDNNSTVAFSDSVLRATFDGVVDEVKVSYHKMDKDQLGNVYDPSLELDYILLVLTEKEVVSLSDKKQIDCTVVCEIRISGDIDNNLGYLSVSRDGLSWQYVSYTITEGGGAE